MKKILDEISYLTNDNNFNSGDWQKREMCFWIQEHIYELKTLLFSMEDMQKKYGNAVLALEALRQWPVISEAAEQTDGAWARNVIDAGLSARLRKND